MGSSAPKGHYYHCTHNGLPYHNSSCWEMLHGTNTLRSHHIITQVFHLQKIEDCYKTPIQPTTAKLNTADGSPMSAIRTMTLHLRIAEFKFMHNFIFCDQLPETELMFGIDMQRKFSLSYAWDKERNWYIQREGKFLVYTNNCDQKATIGTVKSMLKIPPWHNGVMKIKIRGPIIKEYMAYFITDDNTSKGRDLNLDIFSSIHKIKNRTSVNILVSNHTKNISPSIRENISDILNQLSLMTLQ